MERSQQETTVRPGVFTPERGPGWFRLFILLVLLGLLGWWFFSPPNPELIENFYSRGYYPLIAQWLTPITSAIPISIIGILLFFIIFGRLLGFVRIFQGASFGRWFVNTLLILAVLTMWFVLTWGANYQRLPIEEQMNLTSDPISEEGMVSLAQDLITFTTAYQPTSGEEGPDTDKAIAIVSASLYDLVNDIHGSSPTIPDKVKKMPAGMLTYFGGGTVGVISPWLLEAHIEGALPPASQVAVAAHELAHLAGYAGEAEAELLGVLAGLRSEDAFVQYAVAQRALSTLLLQLSLVEYDRLFITLPEQVIDEWDTRRSALEEYRPPEWLDSLQNSTYNQYLRAQGISGGIADYSRGMTLLLKAKQAGWLDDVSPAEPEDTTSRSEEAVGEEVAAENVSDDSATDPEEAESEDATDTPSSSDEPATTEEPEVPSDDQPEPQPSEEEEAIASQPSAEEQVSESEESSSTELLDVGVEF